MGRPRAKTLILVTFASAAAGVLAGWWTWQLLGSEGSRAPASAAHYVSDLEGELARKRAQKPALGAQRGSQGNPIGDGPLFDTQVSESELEAAIQAGNPCAALLWASELSDSKNEGPSEAQYARLLGKLDPRFERLAQAMSASDSLELAQTLGSSDDETLRFYAALSAVGMLDFSTGGREERSEDWAQAYRLLEDLMESSPDNGVYACYYAAAMKRQGSAYNSYAPWVQRCVDSPRPDLQSSELPRAMLAMGAKNPAYRVIGQFLLPHLPQANPIALKEILIDRIKQTSLEEDSIESVYFFGRSMIDSGSQIAEKGGLENIDWFRIDLALGRVIARETFQVLHPDSELLGVLDQPVNHLSPPELEEKTQQKSTQHQRLWTEAWEELSQSPSLRECRTKKLDALRKMESRKERAPKRP
jgi:hypothetical protein